MKSLQLADEMTATGSMTTKPFGVDLLTAFPEYLTRHVELAIE